MKGSFIVKKIILGRKPQRKTKKHSGLKISSGSPRGTLPYPAKDLGPARNFDEIVESKGAELKIQHPESAAQIDRAVEQYKVRYANGELQDWYDTWSEFERDALQPLPQPYKSGKSYPKRM
jgi:hypothetical protein